VSGWVQRLLWLLGTRLLMSNMSFCLFLLLGTWVSDRGLPYKSPAQTRGFDSPLFMLEDL